MHNIAITGVGGGVGQSVLKSLKDTGYNLIALDGDPLATGLYASGKSYLIPYSVKPNFIEELLRICEKEKIAMLFPGLDAELMPLSLNRAAFAAIGTTIVVSRPEVIEISDNKQVTYDKLVAAGINVPLTTAMEDFIPEKKTFPVIIKQKIGGARSKNIFIARDLTEYNAVSKNIGDNKRGYIVMDYIQGDEYTCGSINLNDSCMGVIVMKRILRDGDTYKCFSVKNDVIEQTIKNVMNIIKPFGACNVQLRMKNNVPYIFEINARCSGTTAARTIAGFNEPQMIADYLLKNIYPKFEIKELTILRYWKEFVIDNKMVEELNTSKLLTNTNFKTL